jgi:hypothetical protein
MFKQCPLNVLMAQGANYVVLSLSTLCTALCAHRAGCVHCNVCTRPVCVAHSTSRR